MPHFKICGHSHDVLVSREELVQGRKDHVAFARLFLKKPAIAFLDEATSALDEENERFLSEKLRASGITFVSVGHRSTLKEFHDRLFQLKNDGTSETVPLSKSAPQ